MGKLPPNGSRLSCGASASGRKHPALRYELVGEQPYASFEGRPRQLQALVRRQMLHGSTRLIVATIERKTSGATPRLLGQVSMTRRR